MSVEPIYTGPLTTQISGDIALGKSYERVGRKMMGTLLNISGAAERIERGEAGGYFKKSLQMEDGTVLTVTTNNGHNVLRIETPRPTPTVEYGSEHHVTTGSTPHSVFVPEAKGLDPSHEVPLPRYPQREDEEGEEEKRKDGYEYMWVGCRYTSSDVPFMVLGAMMIEPDTGPPFRDSGLPKRGIVDCIDWWPLGELDVEGGNGEYVLNPDAFSAYPDVDSAIQDLYDSWRNSFGGDTTFDRAEHHIVLGTHAIEVWVNNDKGQFLISANGLRCESINMWQPGMDALWMGYDPYASDQTGAGVRDVGNRHLGAYFADAPNVLWDAVFTLDPNEDLGDSPCDIRPEMLGVRRALERDAGMVTRILPGDYILALHSVDSTPKLQSRRINEVIPIYNDQNSEASGLNRRSGQSDYNEYMQPIDTTTNLGVEIEVRLGKGTMETVLRFQTTIAESNIDDYANMPYGMDWHDQCDPIGGPNPVGPNFAPQYLAINPLACSARWIGHDEVDLYPILGNGYYTHPGDTRRPFFVYIHVVPWSQPSDDHWAENAGRALFKVLEAATAGVYGSMMFSDPGGEDGCAGMFEDSSKSMLWCYDAMAQTLTAVPVVSEMDDYPYGWQEDASMPNGGFQSPYQPEMYWYYPYKYQEKNNCHNSVGIAITAVYDTFYFDNGQSSYFQDPPATTDCC